VRIKVDRTLCAGHALCAIKAPEVYELDDDGFCISDGREVTPGMEDDAVAGANYCPEHAITLEET
jgi:ferredoxin